jgi:hypothetical protein
MYEKLIEDFDDAVSTKRETITNAERIEYEQRFKQQHLDAIRDIT